MLQSLAKFLYLLKYEDPHQNPGSLHSMHFGTCPLTWMSIFYIYKIVEIISIPSTFIKQINACKINLSEVEWFMLKKWKISFAQSIRIILVSYFTNWWETNKYIILDVIRKGKVILFLIFMLCYPLPYSQDIMT